MPVGVQFRFEARFHGTPLGINDAEIDGMPDAPAGCNHVISEDALFARSEAQNRRARSRCMQPFLRAFERVWESISTVPRRARLQRVLLSAPSPGVRGARARLPAQPGKPPCLSA